MANPETLAQFQRQDLNIDHYQNPVEGKSFENLRRFVAFGAVTAVRTYPPGIKPDYSDKRIYYPSIKGGMSLQNWERNLRMTYDYAFGEESLGDIGKRNGNITREATRQIIKKTVRDLQQGAGEDARDRFPFESFDFRKPSTLASRHRKSEARSAISLNISRRYAEGATLEQIKREFPTKQIAKSRKVIKNWGIELPLENKPILTQFEGLRDLDATDEQIQTLLDKISYYRQYEVLKQASIVTNLSTVARKVGFHIYSNQVIFISESLAKEKLPQTKFGHKIKDKNGQEKIYYYYIIATINEPNAIDILRADHDLDDLRINPVIQISGRRTQHLPNTSELKSKEYAPISNLIGQITGSRWIGRRKGGIKTADIIKGSPVSIYHATSGIFYRKSQEEVLRVHLESRLRELGMI